MFRPRQPGQPSIRSFSIFICTHHKQDATIQETGTHFHLGLQNSLFRSGFRIKILYGILIIFNQFITLLIMHCSPYSVALFVLGPNILLRTTFSSTSIYIYVKPSSTLTRTSKIPGHDSNSRSQRSGVT